MRRFLSTTAVILTMSSSAAYAEAHMSNFGSVKADAGDFHASDLIGMRIYNSETELDENQTVNSEMSTEWDDIGEINDLIVSRDGEVRAVILGVGGFLGMGERDVSVSMEEIQVLNSDGQERFLVVSTNREELESAPEYGRDMSGMNQTSDTAQVDTNATMKTDTNDTTQIGADSNVEQGTVVIGGNTDAERPLLQRPAMEREGYQEAQMSEVENLTSDDIEGASVYGASDETVGEIDRLIMSADGKVEQVVINVGGFLGLGEKPVAVTFDELQILKNADGTDYRIYIDSSEEALKSQPEFQD